MSFIITFFRKFLPSNPNYTESDSNNNQITAIKNNNDTTEREASKLEWSVERVLSSGKMLTDNEIYAAVKTLKQQFGGNIKGLYDPQSMNAKRLRKAQFYVQYPERFVQILHDGSLHWFTLSNLRSTKAHQIQSYDSLFVDSTYVHNKMLHTSLKKLLVPLPDDESELCYLHVECTVESVQKQSDTTMCGLFAIAFAVDLCRGDDPTNRVYDETRMREHLYECLKKAYFEPFPSSSSSTTSVKSKTHIIYIDI